MQNCVKCDAQFMINRFYCIFVSVIVTQTFAIEVIFQPRGVVVDIILNKKLNLIEQKLQLNLFKCVSCTILDIAKCGSL
jgi:hypothetical protein